MRSASQETLVRSAVATVAVVALALARGAHAGLLFSGPKGAFLGMEECCQPDATGPRRHCQGAEYTPLLNGEGCSLCLPPSAPFGLFQNLDTIAFRPKGGGGGAPATETVVFMHGLGMDKEIMRD